MIRLKTIFQPSVDMIWNDLETECELLQNAKTIIILNSQTREGRVLKDLQEEQQEKTTKDHLEVVNSDAINFTVNIAKPRLSQT